MLLYKILITLPLIGAFFSSFLYKFFGFMGLSIVSIFCIANATASAIFIVYLNGFLNNSMYFTLVSWFYSEILLIDFGIGVDVLTCIMLSVVMLVSALVHVYSLSYMYMDPFIARFMAFISLFTFFMLILITADNFLQLFLGWEGVGLCSFLLINFWYTRLQAIKSAIKAFIINRLGDLGLTLGIVNIYFIVRAVDFETIFSLVPYIILKKIIFLVFFCKGLNIISFFLFMGAVGKSAQIGLHSWLPDAMEGPTPVSALIHAATMVTAGVFLIIRCSPVIEFTPLILLFITLVGGFTAFLTANVGLTQMDIKKIIAYSTCSQLGFMIFVCGLSNYSISLYHLSNHAFFKALLFLSAGSLMHSINGEQDLRQLGGLLYYIPFTYTVMNIGSLALAGLPSLSSFYSKDLILETILANFLFKGSFIFWLSTITTLYTMVYSFRLMYGVFFTITCLRYNSVLFINDANIFTMSTSLSILTLGGIVTGFMGTEIFLNLQTDFFQNAICNLATLHVTELDYLDIEFVSPFFLIIAAILILSILIIFVWFLNMLYLSFDWHLYLIQLFNRTFFITVKNVVDYNWYINSLTITLITFRFLWIGYNILYVTLDKGILELLLPSGVSMSIYTLSKLLHNKHRGVLIFYIIFFLLFVIILIVLLVLFE